MKRTVFIGLLLLLALASCHGPFGTRSNASSDAVVSPEPQSPQRSQLLAIDSLAWQQPDSALALLLPWLDTVDSSQTFDNHYAQLLLAELLYKNDYAQTNRPALRQAVAYLDSLAGMCDEDTRGASAQNGSPITVFLAARAHYINGVGYYENDSAVPACREYLKALEIMEGRFEEKEMVGEKARFMALTYTHLTGLFSDYYLHEQAIYFGKIALNYYKRYDAPSWHVSWMLNEIGSHYDIMNKIDTAYYYYCKGLAVLEDTNNLTYRDIATRMALLSYRRNGEAKAPLNQMYNLLAQTESKKESLARCSIIGEILYHEQQFDSAYYYLKEVFDHTESLGLKKQAAEWLMEICNAQDKKEEGSEYALFLAPFANSNENQSHVESQLTKLHQDYIHDRLELRHRQQMRKFHSFAGAALVALAALSLVFIVFHFINKKSHKHLKRQNEEKERLLESERHAHKMKQAALAGRLKQRNEELRAHMEERENMRKTLEKQQKRADWSSLGIFLEEDICKEIMNALHGKDIKREAKVGEHAEMKLSATQLSRLDVAIEKHFQGFTKMLTDMYPRISNDEMHQCLLYLLDVEDVQIAHLLFCDYSTVKKRSRKLKTAFKIEKELRLFIKDLVL